MQNILRLRSARRAAADKPEAAAEIVGVIDDLRSDVGDTVTKASAARLLGVSRPTLDKWIARGALPMREVAGRREVVRADLEELAEAVQRLRGIATERPGVMAEAVRRLAAGDPEFAGMEGDIERSLREAEQGDLVPLRIPDSFGPND
jgi:excisionase family DNA binding protein